MFHGATVEGMNSCPFSPRAVMETRTSLVEILLKEADFPEPALDQPESFESWGLCEEAGFMATDRPSKHLCPGFPEVGL